MLTADVDALDELLHSDLLFGHTDGHADGKVAYLETFRSGVVRYADADQRIDSVRIVGDTALVSSHLTMRADFATGSQHLDVVALTVWVERAGSWKMIAQHPTVI